MAGVKGRHPVSSTNRIFLEDRKAETLLDLRAHGDCSLGNTSWSASPREEDKVVEVADLKHTSHLDPKELLQPRRIGQDIDTNFADIRILHELLKSWRHEFVLREESGMKERNTARASDLDKRDVLSRTGVAIRVRLPFHVESQDRLILEVSLADVLHGSLARAIVHLDMLHRFVLKLFLVHGV